MQKLKAFTLAEILITIVIIGIIAAVTLPALINNYRIRQYKTGFWHTNSLIQSALTQTAIEFGYDSPEAMYYICGDFYNDTNISCIYKNAELFKQINDDFISRFKIIDKKTKADFETENIHAHNYTGATNPYYSEILQGFKSANLLIDGSLISDIIFYGNASTDAMTILFDTNGPYKGPNRLGYDIFLYQIGHWSWNGICTEWTTNDFNGRGCYDWAKKDINPDHKQKGYWASLNKNFLFRH